MAKTSLLDCTLRDGGYINDWMFGREVIDSIIDKLCSSQIDYIELGFLRNCDFDVNRTLYNTITEVRNITAQTSTTKFAIMALHNLYDVKKLESWEDGFVDLVRVTFHDYDIDEGLSFVEKVMEKGYKVCCNPINIMGYNDDEILMLLKKINRISPYGFSIVDTFGSMWKNDLIRLYHLVENNLDKSIVVGLHLHENLSQSFSLAQDFIQMLAPARECILDASLMGIGRAPGNLCLELIMEFLNKSYGRNYQVTQAYDAIDDHIRQLKKIEPWGYNNAYAISAMYNLHRNYAEYLIDKRNLQAKDINHILGEVTAEYKTVFNSDYIENIYRNYMDIKVDDSSDKKKLKEILDKRNILILSPGSSIGRAKSEIDDFINKNNPIVFAANFDGAGLFDPDYYFFTNLKRIMIYVDKLDQNRVLVSSNLKQVDVLPGMIFNYSSLAFLEGDGYLDNSVAMLLRLLYLIGVRNVYIAGFDGFIDNADNYATRVINDGQHKNNERIEKRIRILRTKIDMTFLTPSIFSS